MTARVPSASASRRLVHYHTVMRLAEGGIVRAVLDECAVMALRGHAITLITTDAHDVPEEWQRGVPGLPRVIVIPLPRRGERLASSAKSQIKEIVRTADVVRLHKIWSLSDQSIASICRAVGVPYIATLHGMLDDWSTNQKRLKKLIFLKLVGQRYLNRAAQIHCTAKAEVSQAAKWHRNLRVKTIPYIVDLEPYNQLPGPELARDSFAELRTSRPVLLFLSRLHPKKGVDLFLQAVALLRKGGVETRAVIAGTGQPSYEAELKSLAASLQIGDCVTFVGLVKGQLKLSLYQAADLFVLPTHQENFGLVLPEALACGVPVVTTRGTDIWQELQGAGAFISDTSADAVARTIELALQTRKTDASLIERGRHWVMTYLDPQSVSERYEQMYNDARGV